MPAKGIRDIASLPAREISKFGLRTGSTPAGSEAGTCTTSSYFGPDGAAAAAVPAGGDKRRKKRRGCKCMRRCGDAVVLIGAWVWCILRLVWRFLAGLCRGFRKLLEAGSDCCCDCCSSDEEDAVKTEKEVNKIFRFGCVC